MWIDYCYFCCDQFHIQIYVIFSLTDIKLSLVINCSSLDYANTLIFLNASRQGIPTVQTTPTFRFLFKFRAKFFLITQFSV